MEEVVLRWQGPFAWRGTGAARGALNLADAEVFERCGVYLWTVEHHDGLLVYAAGQISRPFRKRFREHNREYRAGRYTIFDAAAMKRGERRKVWPGFWFTKNRSPVLEREYSERSAEIRRALLELLAGYRVFVAPLPPNRRLLRRVEAAIMGALYAADGPAATLPDHGMALAPRWPDEPGLRVRSITPALIYGLPGEFEA